MIIYKMKKYLQFLKYAFKEQRQYRTNFFASIGTMIFNDACFCIIFLIFLWYFTWTGLTMWNFLVLIGISCAWYWIVHWLLFNIGRLSDIIEQWKLDYYLSFPVKPLCFLATTKVWITDMWDIIFWLICLWIYAFVYADNPAGMVLLKWLAIFAIATVTIIGIYIAIGSISFWLQKWSKVQDLFNSMFVSFSQYPPEIYKENKLIYIAMCVILFPWILLPYYMLIWSSTIWQWLLLIWLAIAIFVIWILVFKRWLKRYSSGNLVHQM